jgi:hypothetical protein
VPRAAIADVAVNAARIDAAQFRADLYVAYIYSDIVGTISRRRLYLVNAIKPLNLRQVR